MAQASALFRGSSHASMLAAVHVSALLKRDDIRTGLKKSSGAPPQPADAIYVSSDEEMPEETIGGLNVVLDDAANMIQLPSPVGKRATDDSVMIANELKKRMEEADARLARELQASLDAECAQELQMGEDALFARQLDTSLNGSTETRSKQTNSAAAAAAADAAAKRALASATRGTKGNQCATRTANLEDRRIGSTAAAAAAADGSTQPQLPLQQFTRPIYNEGVACHFNSAVQLLVSIPNLHQSIEYMIELRANADGDVLRALVCSNDQNREMLAYLRLLKDLFRALLSTEGNVGNIDAAVDLRKKRAALWESQRRISPARLGPLQYFACQQAADESIDLLVYQHGLVAPIRSEQIGFGTNAGLTPLVDFGQVGQQFQWFSMQARPSPAKKPLTLLEAIKAALIDERAIVSKYIDTPDYAIVHIDRAIKVRNARGGLVDSKIQSDVTVDEQIDLQSVIQNPKGAIEYVPVAMIVHIGNTMTSGHYIALARRKNETRVAVYNDGIKYTDNGRGAAPFATFREALTHSCLKGGSVTHVLLYRKDKWAAIRGPLG